MSASSATTNLKLSQFTEGDHPTWIGDYNSDMVKIDGAFQGHTGDLDTLAGQVEDLTTQQNNTRQSVNVLREDVNTNTTNITKNKSSITSLENEQQTTDVRLEALENDVANILGEESWIFVCDSYDTVNNGFTQIIKKINPSVTIYNTSVSGAGFTTEDRTFLGNLQKLNPSIPNPSAITKIIVVGGHNDATRYSNNGVTIKSAISAFCAYCKATYVNSRVYIGFAGVSIAQHDNIPNFAKTLQCYMEAEFYDNATYMKGIENVLRYYNKYLSDNIHPNTTGLTALANAINSFLITGVPITVYNYIEIPLQPIDLIWENNPILRIYQFNDSYYVYVNYTGAISGNLSADKPKNSLITLGDLRPFTGFSNSNYKVYPVNAIDATKGQQIAGTILIGDNHIYLRFFSDLSKDDTLIIYDMTMNFPVTLC